MDASPQQRTRNRDGKRVSRACLSCRARKTRCDLDSDGISGNPPCRRCSELQLKCVLAKSRRGGPRVKGVKGSSSNSQGTSCIDGSQDIGDSHCRQLGQEAPEALHGWPSPESTPDWLGESPGQSTQTIEEPSRTSAGLEGHFASADLLNPSDALDLLAQVAHLDPGGQSGSLEQDGDTNTHNRNPPRHAHGAAGSSTRFPPIANGILTWPDASHLVKSFHDKFHHFFPVAYSGIFDGSRPMSEWAEIEPYLFTAILTVASRDDPSWFRVSKACSLYMESLIPKLIYTGSTSLGSVEALIILAEWAPLWPQDNSTIGCGQEDHASWMLIGMAIRLGYLQRLEQTALLPESGVQSGDVSRKRIAWAACYMCDRQVSIRLGKGFWSRGPIPSINWRAADFPSLQAQPLGPDNMALLFQAQIELIQLYSNAHDILYSSSAHRRQMYMGGEYIRYIDDFASVLRKWKLSWVNYPFTPAVKASMVLSFEFLRLYINAFAFQATLNRAVSQASQRNSGMKGQTVSTLFSEVAGNPDARFIYESIDAANSLLSILNSFIDPVAGLKHMPLKYCLYVIYAAVFLFKARLAGAISNEADDGVRRAIQGTIAHLQKMSDNPLSLGRRYARSLRLLWRNSTGKQSAKTSSRGESLREPQMPTQGAALGSDALLDSENPLELDPLNGFSWRDLDSLGQYITSNSAQSMPDGMSASTELSWDHGSSWVDSLEAGPQYDSVWSGHDIIF